MLRKDFWKRSIVPSVSKGVKVKAGDPIGTIDDIPTGPHLHFAIRLGLYDISTDAAVMYAGALLPATFPEKFVDPGLVWQTHTIKPPEVCAPLVP